MGGGKRPQGGRDWSRRAVGHLAPNLSTRLSWAYARETLESHPPIRVESPGRLQGGRPYYGKLARDSDNTQIANRTTIY